MSETVNLNVHVSAVWLQKLKVAIAQAVNPELMDVVVDVEDSFIVDAIVARVRGFVWGQGDEPVVEVRYPADWWQAVKARWLPAWARRRWPVRETVHTVDARVVYPTLRIALPREQHVLTLQKRTRVDVT